MCLVTLAVWIILFVVALVSIQVSDNNTTGAIVSLICIGLGVVLPVIVNFWRPLLFRWQSRRNALENKLLSEGVLTKEDMEKGARAVEIREVKPGSSRCISGSKQRGFILLDGGTLRILGEKNCYASDSFSVIPGCTGRCSKCWVIWACGGDSFRARLKIEGADRDFLLRCFEGRTLRQCARATEMIEELIESEKSVDTQPAATGTHASETVTEAPAPAADPPPSENKPEEDKDEQA